MAVPNSDQILQAVIDTTPDAIFVKDLNGCYVLVNAAAARFLGKAPEEIVGKHDLELYPEETARGFIEADNKVLETGEAHSFEGVATGEGGTTQAYLVTKGVYRDRDGRIIGLFGISHDVTELRQARETLEQTREALFRSQKMEAVGQLTGGIAHDFNNILAIILGNVELLRAYLPKDKYADEIIDAVLRATMHGRDLTGHLLAFSRRRLLNPQPVDVNALVGGIVKLLGRTLGTAIVLNTETCADPCVAFVDPGALEAAVLNIALNARDAMPNGGTLTIRTSSTTIGAGAAAGDDLKPGAYVALALQDTGTGMTPDVVARVFEPFFTTKSGGRGTGLGLSMVYGFAKQSNGTVTIESQPGRGTTVRMLLPVKGATRPAPPGLFDAQLSSTPRTILLVEDEADVRQTVRRQLETLGHTVIVADASMEALLLMQGPALPDVLITDVVLGAGMNGVELVAAVRAVRPNLPVIFMSGYTTVAEAEARIRDVGAPLLPKPFTTPQLERAVQEACAQPANSHDANRR
jgi:PAS domain S-box-containing protein